MRNFRADWRIRRDPHVLAASVVLNLLTFALPLMMLQIYDRIIPRKGFESLTVLAIGVVVAIALELTMRVARTQLMSLAGDAFARKTHERIFNRLLKSDLASVEKDTPGVHLDRISSIDRVREFRFGETAMAALDLPFAFIFLVVIGLIAPPLAVLVTALLLVSMFIMGRLQSHAAELGERKHEVDRRRFSYLIEVISNIEAVKSLNIEAFMERRYERLMATTAAIGAEATERANYAQAVTGAIGQYTPAFVAGIGAIFVIEQWITVGALAAVTLLASRIVQPVLRLSALKSSDDDVRRAEREIEEFLNAPDTALGAAACQQLDLLELKNISVLRSGSASPMFDGLNLTLKRGEIIVLDGTNGSGRSSLLWLIMGYFQPNGGQVLVNGRPMRDFMPASLRRRIAYLPSQPRMLAGTVLDNMTNFQPELFADDAFEVAEALGLADYFAKHQEGLNTRVGHGLDAGLPTSVSQRVPLVGALVGHPDLILFDEANANLDMQGDQRLLAYLSSLKGRAAIIMVTQRPSYQRIADRHYMLRDGKLVEVQPEFPAANAPQVQQGQSA
ncbi:MAG: ATP-binding cassette domain-containing protein [Hyphomicrobiaceae bacterium]|nr:ATP-binding cassette domain-containing protein [Hyphomicrobiaceae bacterium]